MLRHIDASGSHPLLRTGFVTRALQTRRPAAGVELVTTEMVAYEWVRSAEHPAFKAMLALVK